MPTSNPATVNLHSPGPIGDVTPGTGAFTGLSVTSDGINFAGVIAISQYGADLGGRSLQRVGSLDVVNGVTPTTSHLYGTFTDASNYERLSITCDATGIHFASEAAGTGTARAFAFSGAVNMSNGLTLSGGFYLNFGGMTLAGSDLEIANSSKGVILTSPGGTQYRITVANGGALTSTAL